MKVYGQLENAALENLAADPTVLVQGRIYLNTANTKLMLDDGTNKRALLRNDQFCVFGTSATAGNNVRLNRGGNAVLQFVIGSDTTAEGTLSSSLASIQANLTNSTADIFSFTDQAATPATPSSGVTKFYTKAGLPYKLGSDGFETLVGSGQGTGTFNYLSNGDFENGIASASLATVTITNNLPASAPSAGAASLALSLETSAPLQYLRSLRVTAASAWAAGASVALGPAFTVQPNHRGKVLTAKVDYQVVTGQTTLNYSGVLGSQSLSLQVYDVTAGAWVPSPAGSLGFNTSATAQTVSCTFQSSVVSGQQYQFYVVALTASTGACAVLFDAASVSPQAVINGAAMTDWVSYTPTFSASWGTTSNVVMKSRRVGDSLEVKGVFQSASATAATATMSVGFNGINANVTIDTNKVPVNSLVGKAAITNSSTTYFTTSVLSPPSNQNYIQFGAQTSTTPEGNTTTASAIAGSSCYIQVFFSVPIVGWSSNVQLSSDTDTRVVAMTANGSATSIAGGSTTQLVFSTVLFDNTGSYSAGNFTVPVSGVYDVAAEILTTNSSWTANQVLVLNVFKNGTIYNAMGSTGLYASAAYRAGVSGSSLVQASAGDVLSVRLYSDLATTLTGASVSIKRLSGPSIIAATESVNARYTDTAGFAVPANANTIYKFPTAIFDTHSAYSASTGLYTCPVSGKFRVTAGAITTTANISVTQAFSLILYKNGVAYSQFAFTTGNGNAANYGTNGADTVSCVAGDTLAIWAYCNVAVSTIAGATQNHVSFERIGN